MASSFTDRFRQLSGSTANGLRRVRGKMDDRGMLTSNDGSQGVAYSPGGGVFTSSESEPGISAAQAGSPQGDHGLYTSAPPEGDSDVGGMYTSAPPVDLEEATRASKDTSASGGAPMVSPGQFGMYYVEGIQPMPWGGPGQLSAKPKEDSGGTPGIESSIDSPPAEGMSSHMYGDAPSSKGPALSSSIYPTSRGGDSAGWFTPVDDNPVAQGLHDRMAAKRSGRKPEADAGSPASKYSSKNGFVTGWFEEPSSNPIADGLRDRMADKRSRKK